MNEFFGQPVGILTKARADALYLPLTDVTTTPTASKVPRADGSHILAAGWMPAFTGDATSVAGATALTLATVNASPNTYALATLTVNAKGLVTSASAASTTGSGSVVLATSPTITTPSIAKLANLTTNGLVTTSGGNGTLSVNSSSDPLTQYALLAGRAGGQTLIGGTAASEILTLNSTSDPTKGQVRLATTTLVADGLNNRVGINITAPLQALHIFDGHLRLDQVAIAGAPTVATGAAGVLTGAYQYVITFVTPIGETESGTFSAVVNPSSQQVTLTNIAISADANVTSRKIYRTTAGGLTTAMKLVTTIADNTTTTYSDNIADGSLTTKMPWRNTTGGEIFISGNRSVYIDSGYTSVGVGAGANGGGYRTSIFGALALASITSGTQNTAMGWASLNAITSGASNTGVGSSTGVVLTTGSNNTLVGQNAAAAGNQTGGQNTFIGAGSGFGVASNSHSDNTGIGYQAGLALTTGNQNILIGRSTGSTITTGSANLLLGYSIQTPAVGTANFMSIGNLIFSAGIDGTGTTLSSGNIGIGVVAPGTKLHIVKTDAGTNTVVDVETTGHYSTATPAASYGTGKVIEGHSSNNSVRSMSRMRSLWTTATDASRATRSVLSGFDTAERDVIGWGANGSAALLGFYPTVAAAPIVQPTTAIAAATFAANTSLIANDTATWDSYTIGQVVKALRNLGILA